MEVENRVVIKIEGKITTSLKGLSTLMQFYFEASKYFDSTIEVDFSKLTWIEANLSAFFKALTYKLKTENNLVLVTNFTYAYDNFHVLFRNGCFQHEDYNVEDLEKTTIPLNQFLPSEMQNFSDYIQKQLMANRGMNFIDKKIKNQIHSDLYDVFQNISRHARTELPAFICGQYYPNQKRFMLTLVDLGVGFLIPINQHQNGRINTDIDAIKWAVEGRSSKVLNTANEMGGFGLSGIYDYCMNNNGEFQIYTGTGFWSSDLVNSGFTGSRLSYSFQGSVLNLIFATED
jgi:hypothetical protein